MEWALVGIAVYLAQDPQKNICKDIRIAMGAVAPFPMRAKKAEEILRGRILDSDLIEKVAMKASKESRPRSFPEYKKEMVRVLTKRAIKLCLNR
jgi:carbon-monoxide dehydrogenase medium subunit